MRIFDLDKVGDRAEVASLYGTPTLEGVERDFDRYVEANAFALGLREGQSFPYTQTEAGIVAGPVSSSPVGTLPMTPAAGGAFRKVAPKQGGTSRAEKIQIAQWMGSIAQANGFPPELPVMCALVESDLTNLTFGDRDSEGFFQIRVGIHGRAAVETPEAQMEWWVREAKHYTEVMASRGIPKANVPKLDPRKEPPSARVYGLWCQAIERSAYPDKYRHKFDEARNLLNGR